MEGLGVVLVSGGTSNPDIELIPRWTYEENAFRNIGAEEAPV